MKTYNKLVRDKIPEIIAASGKSSVTRVLSRQECLRELDKKLAEELKEYLESGDVEELADMAEVVRAILENKGVTYEEFELIRQDKADKRGGFLEAIFLETVTE